MMLRRLQPYLKDAAFIGQTVAAYVVISIATFLMLRSIAGYTSFRDDAQFLAMKQAYIDNVAWKTAFYIHVFSAVVALFAGFTQFSTQLMQHNKALHRFMGRVYVLDIIFINFPAALVMGIYANGGVSGKTAFLLLDFLWAYFTFRAYECARAKDFVSHKRFMIRSYALTFSAITLRSWKIALSAMFVIEPAQLYIIIAWLGFVPNLLVAEWLIRTRRV